jgi:hypothetical protein
MLFDLHPGVRLYYPFRHRDPHKGKWIRARYVAERHVIAERYAEWQVTGPPEIRTRSGGGSFNPYRMVTHAELMQLEEQPPQINPHLAKPPAIDVLEAFLLRVFLRRYITYCARRRRFAAMNGAARLFAEVTAKRAARPALSVSNSTST